MRRTVTTGTGTITVMDTAMAMVDRRCMRGRRLEKCILRYDALLVPGSYDNCSLITHKGRFGGFSISLQGDGIPFRSDDLCIDRGYAFLHLHSHIKILQLSMEKKWRHDSRFHTPSAICISICKLSKLQNV